MNFVETLTAALGADLVTPAAEVPDRYRKDWSPLAPVAPLALVRPRRVEDVSTTLRLCNAARVGVVPQGGMTGLSGGAHPDAGTVAISMDRMTRIEEVDTTMGTLTAEAGATLQLAQQAAEDHGLLLGIDIGSRGSCTLGGVVSTNGGGTQVIRYGMARDHVLGIEAVLADGTVMSSLNKLLKNNVGLDTKQLFIGTEGLLGIVTRVVLRLHPRPTDTATAFVGMAGSEAAINLLSRARATVGPMLTSFEVMWPSFFDRMSRGIGASSPLAGRHGAYAIVEASGFRQGEARAALETCLGEALEADAIEDAVIAASGREEKGLWAVRESVAEYGTVIGPIIPFDIGIPLARMGEAVARLEAGIEERWPGAIAMNYGHIGDSNLHLVVSVPSAGAAQPQTEVKTYVFDMVRELGGTISAEHGVGATKRGFLGYSRSDTELALMRSIKTTMDPNGILNPGKSFAPDAVG